MPGLDPFEFLLDHAKPSRPCPAACLAGVCVSPCLRHRPYTRGQNMHALPPRLLIAFMCLSLADCSTARAMASGLRPEAAKTGRGRTVMLEGDLAELIDRRWQARLFGKDGNVRVAALVFHREGWRPGACPGSEDRSTWQ